MEPLRFEKFAFRDELWFPPIKLFLNRFQRPLDSGFRHYVVGLRIDRDTRCMFLYDFAEQRIDGRNRIHLFSPKFDTKRLILITRINFNYVTADAKSAALEIHI